MRTPNNTIAPNTDTGRYTYPELPENHYWEITYTPTQNAFLTFLTVAIKKPGLLFPRTVATQKLAHFYANTAEDGLRPYEPGNLIRNTATKLAFNTFPYTYKPNTAPYAYIDSLPKGKGTETILDAVYKQNKGTHHPGDPIHHYTY